MVYIEILKNHAFSVINFFKQDDIKGDYDQSVSASIYSLIEAAAWLTLNSFFVTLAKSCFKTLYMFNTNRGVN